MSTTIMKRSGNSHVPVTTFSGIVDQFFQNNLDRFLDDNFWGFNGGVARNYAPVNIRETDKSYELELAAPGLNKEDFKVNIADGMLTISFEHSGEKTSQNGWVRQEYKLQSFSRSFNLDDSIVDANKIEARYNNGLLQLTLPKKENAHKVSKAIEIK